jgi:hypothetical protein
MINRLQGFHLTPLNPDPRAHAPKVRARGDVVDSDGDVPDVPDDGGLAYAFNGFKTLDRADPTSFNKNRRGLTSPATEVGPNNDGTDATDACVLY